MAIFLLILKIIGIILLSILALIILILALILLVPIRYSVYADKYEDKGKLYFITKFSYLLHIVSGNVASDNGYSLVLKVFGIKLKQKDKAEKQGEKNKKNSEKNDKKNDSNREKSDIDSQISCEEKPSVEVEYSVDWNGEERVIEADTNEVVRTEDSDVVATVAESDDKSEGDLDANNTVDENNDTDSEEVEKKKFSDKLKEFSQALSQFGEKISEVYDKGTVKIDRISDIITEKSAKLNRAYSLINDYRNKRALKRIWDQLGYILKKILPRKADIMLHIGFEDPSTTGSILAAIGFFAPLIPGDIDVVPEYDKDITEGRILLKGKITLYILIVVLWKLFFDKDVRRLWRIYRGKTSK